MNINALKNASYALVIGGIMLGSCATAQTQSPAETSASAEQNEPPNAVLRTATIYVKNWDASLRFYTKYMGYELLVEQAITEKKSLASIGARASDSARIAYLKPVSTLIKRPFEGNYLAIIEIKGDDRDELRYTRSNDPKVAMQGEIVLAHQVVGIDDMYLAMQEDKDVLVVSTLSLSGSGQSRSYAVIDPNGVRVEIYEYVASKDPDENP